MATIKLTTTNIQVSHLRVLEAEDSATMLKLAEKRAPINVHSHGKLIEQYIWQLEAALESAKAFQFEVQGR